MSGGHNLPTSARLREDRTGSLGERREAHSPSHPGTAYPPAGSKSLSIVPLTTPRPRGTELCTKSYIWTS